MKARSSITLALASVAALAVAGYRYGAKRSIPPTSPIRGMSLNLFPSADALPLICGTGIQSRELIYKPEVIPYCPSCLEWDVCKSSSTGPSVPIHRPTIRTTLCDGQILESGAGPTYQSTCDPPASNCSAPNTWDDIPEYGQMFYQCIVAPPAETVSCRGKCPTKDKCSDDASGRTQVGNPVCVAGSPSNQGQGALIYELPLFPLPAGGGFPSTFSVHLSGQEAYDSVAAGGPLGPRAMHSFAPSMVYGTGTPNFVRVWGEDAQVIPFTETSTDVWVAEDGRVATITLTRQTGCSGTALVTLGNGIKLTFGEIGSTSNGCTGALREGRIQRIDRPNGDYLIFTANADGYISSVADRLQSSVQLSYLRDGEPDGHLGILTSVTAPAGTFTFERSPTHDFLTKVNANGVMLWTLNYFTTGGSTALSSVLDANSAIQNAWTYTDSNRTRVLTEQGPGSDSGNTLTFAYPTTSQTTVSFTAADGTSKTNTFDYASQFSGERSQITDRQNQGACLGCGASNAKFRYWAGTTFVRKLEDGNGFVTVFQDLDLCADLSEAATCNNATQQANAYDAKGNPKVSYAGCTGGIASPSCTGATRTTKTVLTGTRIVASETRPSAGGGTVTNSRTFDGTRIVLDRTQGKTASALDGSLNTTKTRSTKNTYGGGELTVREGPFDDDGTGMPPSTAPRADFAYYALGEQDACSGTVPNPDNNKYLLKTVTRWVDGVRTLVEKRCNYDSNGRARTVRNAEGTDTTYTFDWRGNVLTTTVEPSQLNLQTCFTHDANGNLREIRLPRSTANGRTGFKYEYDSADRIQYVRQGHFSDTSCPATPGSGTFTKLQSMHYVTDAWGNRTTTEYLDASDTAVVTESSKFDAFNRLVELARPANSSTNRTLYSYDTDGNLLQMSDHQGDDVKYVDKDNPTSGKYDRFGRLSQIEQEICAHPSGSENGACSDATPARTQYSYDVAGALSEVRIKEPRIAGNDIVTSYVTDDFGSVVKVTSPDATASSFYRYDGAGRLLEAKDPRGKIFHYRYDRLGRLVAKINMTAGGDPNSVVCNGDTEARCEIIYCYDDQDAVCGFTNGGGPNYAERLSAVNDKGGRVEFLYDRAGRMTQEQRTMLSGASFFTRYTHDANGNMTVVEHPTAGPSGGGIVQILKTFDEANRETAVTYKRPGSGSEFALINDIQWYPFSGLKSWKPAYAQFKIELIQESGSGRLTEIKMTDGAATKESFLYSYAWDGNVISQSSAHDSLSRLTANNSRAFGYDEAGNRTSGPTGTYSYASATNGRLTTGASTSYSFDAAGNVTGRGSWTLTVADDGTVSAIQTGSGTTTYTRDHRNLRIDKAGAGGASTYFYSPSGDMLQWTGTTVAAGGACGLAPSLTPFENYFYVGGRRLGFVATRRCTNGTWLIDGPRWFFPDNMDAPQTLYKSQSLPIWSATLDAFADNLTEKTDPDGDGTHVRVPFRLPGQFALTTQEGGPPAGLGSGLVENWNRVYDTLIGRYLQPDPAWRERANYPYAANSPLQFIDRDGRDITGFISGGTLYLTIDQWSDSCCYQGTKTWSFGPASPLRGAPMSWLDGAQSVPAAVNPNVTPPAPLPLLGHIGAQTISTCCDQDREAETRLTGYLTFGFNYNTQSGMTPASIGYFAYSPEEFWDHIVGQATNFPCQPGR